MYDLLNGTRVLDLTSVVLGPVATQYLGDFGADVIKVEPPSGDIFRYAGPARNHGMAAGFLNFNRNKRSVTLDLKTAEGSDSFNELLRDADVLVHNMRAGAAKRLGLDPETLSKSHPKLVHCVAPGFGSRGRDANKPAYDDIIQAASGLAHLNRGPDGAPRFIPAILCDKIAGMHLAMAVLSGLVRRTKNGKGCFVEVPMFESLVSFVLAEHLAGESFVPAKGQMGYQRLLSPYRKPFATKDGYIAVLPYSRKHWTKFLGLIGKADLAKADWVQNDVERSERIGELYEIISEAMPSQTSEEWLSQLSALDIPCTQVNDLNDVLNNDHLQDAMHFPKLEHPSEGTLRTLRSPFWVSGVSENPDDPPPQQAPLNAKVAWR